MNNIGRTLLLQRFIVEELLLGDGEVTEDEDILTTGLVDSIGIVRLLGFIEDELGVAIPPEDVTLENFLSVNAIESYLKGRNV